MSATIRGLLTYSCDIVCSSPNETLVCELEETNISDTGLTKLADILYVSELSIRTLPYPISPLFLCTQAGSIPGVTNFGP